MNGLLVFFALPVATIILAIVLQKILKCPLLVGATFFAIYLIVAFAIAPNGTLLIYAILYSILAYVTAVLTCIICRINSRFGNIIGDCAKPCNVCGYNNDLGTGNNLITANNSCNSGNNVATVRIIDSRNNNCITNDNNSVTTVTTTTGSGPLNTTSNTFSQGRYNNVCTCGRVCSRR